MDSPRGQDAQDIGELLASLERRLDDYAAQLSPREQRLLVALLSRAMAPAERLRASGSPSMLTSEEEAFLRTLEDSESGAGYG